MADTKIDILAGKFGSDVVRFDTAPGGLGRVTIAHPAASAEVYLQGAHVTAFRPAGRAEVLFVSPRSGFAPGVAIRGGVPICFPWFGPREAKPAHGFARTTPWDLVAVTEGPRGVELRFELRSSQATRALWPADFVAEYVVSIGRALGLALHVTNTSPAAIEYEDALHTYLRVSEARSVTVEGLRGATYLDKPTGQARRVETDDRVTFPVEVDRVYLDTTAACTVVDPGPGRQVVVNKTGSKCTVVWNPGPARASKMADLGADNAAHFVCVETANCADHPVTLGPGETHVTTASIETIS